MNQSPAAHALVLRGASGVVAQAAVAPSERRLLQARLVEGRYSLVCTSPGHAERAVFTTYPPATSLR